MGSGESGTWLNGSANKWQNYKYQNIWSLNCVRVVWQYISVGLGVCHFWNFCHLSHDLMVFLNKQVWFCWFFILLMFSYVDFFILFFFFSRLTWALAGGPGHFLPCYLLQLLWENIKVFQSSREAMKPTLFSPPGSKCSEQPPFKNIRGAFNRNIYFKNCYVFVLAGFFRCMKGQWQLCCHGQQKQPPKDYLRVVAPWTEPWEKSSWGAPCDHAWNTFFISHWDRNFFF